MTPSLRSAVLARLHRLYDDVVPLLSGDDPSATEDARASLAEPLRLAVVGRVSSGKSTLVNALVGRRIAPTSAGECTRVVTWYRFGAPDRADLELVDGSMRPVRLAGQGLPNELDVPAEKVSRLVVHLASGPLRDLTLIDTPGLDTLTAANDAATRRAILGAGKASQRAAGAADALLFLIGDAARRSDVDFLADFRASAGRQSATALNAVGLLAQADRFGSGPFDPRDPFDVAREVAQGLATTHRAELADVLPVSGLLAETARTGRISESLARRVADLAGEEVLALSLRRQDPALQDLYRFFGPYGVGAGRDQAANGAARLKSWCQEVSGIADLENVVRSRLVPRADLLKANRALGVLATAAGRADDAEKALALVETATFDPDLHPLQELRALHALTSEVPGSPLVAQLSRFVDDPDPVALLGIEAGGPDELALAARRRSAEATRTAALAVFPAEADAGRVLARSYQLLARRLRSDAGG
ncbi:dynamin family protein [Tenggerimyces flavus]|uniref:Dynamin family protein n=1 Tax=Tenggerimyces flavus TaxID=1708749 RepID=A0ABV7YC36_9ACTN|nr:dynamin family protein [Tenggerimyces flavus]MBM7783739.1 energy-coupling factor transporter ATP-binding protein EcfA2 [Tenggerimyces flavus]